MSDWSRYRYKAFISYAHRDEKWARWLHRSLETYRIPRHLVGQKTSMGAVPQRLAPVFRDRDELATATDLGDKLRRALEDSACLIVICSTASARSHWVNEEILTFKRMGRGGRIFSLIVDGEPYASQRDPGSEEECFPRALQYQLDATGELGTVPAEPIAADARQGKDGRRNAQVKLIAGMLDLGFDDLRQRELQRRNRRLAVIAGSAVAGMVFAIGLATYAVIARNEAERQRHRAETEAETARQTADFMVSMFSVSDPSEARGRSVTAREILTAGAQRISTELADQPAVQAQLMDTIGSVFTSLGLFDDARTMLQKALDNRRALPSVSDLEIVQSLLHMANVMTIKAELEPAETLYLEAIDRLQKAGEQNSREMADAHAGLAELYFRMGRYEDAEPVLISVLEDRRVLLGPEDPAVADAIEELGLNQFDQGKFEPAERYLRQALVLREQIFGNEPHPDVAENMNNLALLLMESGRYQESEELSKGSMAMYRELYGDKHPSLADGYNNLGLLYRAQGELDQAAASYRQAIAMNRDLLGAAHPKVARVMNNLAFIYFEGGDLEEAIAVNREALAIQEETLGREHPEVAATMSTLGRWLTDSGDPQAAEPLLRGALDLYATLLPEDHPDVALAQLGLARFLTMQRAYAEALPLARAASATLADTYGEDHWITAVAHSTEGGVLAGLGRTGEAETLLRSSYDALSTDEGARPVYVEAARQRLIALYTATGRSEQAAAL